MPGIALTADFGRYHKKDQPWAATGAGKGWVVSAEWRDLDRHAIAQETASWTLDANGGGTAQLSAAFLNAVFQAAADRYQKNRNDTASWHHRPGLYLNVYADDATYGYYDVACPAGAIGAQMSNWNFGGSLSDLVAQLALAWWPGLPALANVAAQANLGDPLTVRCAYPVATLTCAGQLVGGYCWYQGANGESCTAACAGHGGYNDATRTYAGSAGSNANCQAVIDALGVPGTAVTTDNSCGIGVGCYDTGGLYRCTKTTTDPNSSSTGLYRMCACNN